MSKMASVFWHFVNINSILPTESGIVIEGVVLKYKRVPKERRKLMKTLLESKEWSSVECKWSANLAKKLPPVSKMRLLHRDEWFWLYLFNNEDHVVAFSAPSLEVKSRVDEGCLELLLSLVKNQEKVLRYDEEIEKLQLAKVKEEETKRSQRKARNEENELRRREEEGKLMESRAKARDAELLAGKFKQGKSAFIAKDWGR